MTGSGRGPVARAARFLGCTEGQVYTMAVGLTLALLLAVPGIPAVLRDRPAHAGTDVAMPAPRDEAASGVTASPEEPPTAGTPPGASTGVGALPRLGPSTAPRSAPPAPPTAPDPAPPPADAVTPPPAPTNGVFARVGHPGAPGGLAVTSDGMVFVTTDNGSARGSPGPSHVFAYGSDGALVADHVVAGQPDDRPGGLAGAAVEAGSGHVVVLDPEAARIVSVDPTTGAQSVRATIPDLPPCVIPLRADACQHGIEDRPPFPVSAAYDGRGDLFVTDPAQDTIWRLRPGADAPEPWHRSPSFTTGDGPHGIAVDGGDVVFTVGTSHDVAAFGSGALYRVTVEPDGSAGEATLVRAFPDGDRPGALAVGRRGTAYVAVPGRDAIVVVAPDGSDAGEVEPTGTGSIALVSPSALALAGGALLVANGRDSEDPDDWAVLTVAVDDGPIAATATPDDRSRQRPPQKVR